MNYGKKSVQYWLDACTDFEKEIKDNMIALLKAIHIMMHETMRAY